MKSRDKNLNNNKLCTILKKLSKVLLNLIFMNRLLHVGMTFQKAYFLKQVKMATKFLISF